MSHHRVMVMPGDAGGCGHYRLAWPAEQARLAGADVVLQQLGIAVRREGGWRDPDRRDMGRSVLEVWVPDCDVLVVQRPLHLPLVECLEIIHAAGVRVVIDLDDDFHALSPANSAYDAVHPTKSPLTNWNHLMRALRCADLVTCTTAALAARYGAGVRTAVLPNRIPTALLKLDATRRPDALAGWAGTMAVHPGDLESSRGGIAAAVPVERFRVVGDGRGTGRALGYKTDPTATGWLALMDYFTRLATTYDVGVVPLASTKFNDSKSWLKALEHAAVGIPVVMAATPDNMRLHALGVGLVAARPRDWSGHLTKLMAEEHYRLDMGATARITAAAHTIEGHVDAWVEAWLSTIDTGGAP